VIVIVEGPDGAGKTQLARQLAQDHQLLYHHEGPPPVGVDPLHHYGSILEHARYVPSGIVFDRFALGERVYGPMLRGKDGLGEDGWRIFTRLLKAADATTILCLPPFATCHANWASGRPELFHEERLLEDSYLRWAFFATSSDYAIDLVYDYTRDPFPTLRTS
jgi:hypothetical protein